MKEKRVPQLGAVLRLQLELLWRMKFVAGLAMVLGLILLALYELFEAPPIPPWLARPRLSTSMAALIAVGGMAAAITWFHEGPGNRRYHWAMPVRRELHDALRIIAGATWLMLLIAVFCVAGWFLEDPIQRKYWLSDAPWFWASCFLIPLLVYTLATVPALLTDKPLLWIAIAMFASIMLATKTVERRAPALADLGDALFSDLDPPSLGVALLGGLRTAPWEYGRERYRVYEATADSVFASMSSITAPPAWRTDPVNSKRIRANFDRAMRKEMGVRPPFSPKEWLASLAVWYAIALLGIALSLRRRPNV